MRSQILKCLLFMFILKSSLALLDLNLFTFSFNIHLPSNEPSMPEILTHFKKVGEEIDINQERHVESVKQFINLQLLAKRNDITNTINSIKARFKELQDYVIHQDTLENSTLLAFAEWTVSPNGFAVYHLLDRLHLTMFGSENQESSPNTNIFKMLALSYGKDEKCLNQQATQQYIYSLYTDVALTELKGYMMMEFSYTIFRVFGKGNFTQEAEIRRNNYKRNTERSVRLLQDIIKNAERVVWRCDPESYVEGKTYEKVTRFLQAYIENEVDMTPSRECNQNCAAYTRTQNEGCYMDQFCAHQERCTGSIYDCKYVGDLKACPSPLESLRRYENIEISDTLNGDSFSCPRGSAKATSWKRYIIWDCDFCLCYCDDKNSVKTDRYFNLRDTLSNVQDNYVVTGLRFVKTNRIFHLQIQEGQLVGQGMINENTVSWKHVDNYTLYQRGVNNNQDFYTLTYDGRSIDLDNIEVTDTNYVVTGVRFRLFGTHLNLEARFTKFDFATGKLFKENNYWKSNSANEYQRSKLYLDEKKIPIKTTYKSEPDSYHNQYLQFSPSSFYHDVGQTTVPFIDIQDVTTKPPVPLAGVGLYHKGRGDFGGFLAPKLMTYNFGPHIQVPT